MQVRERGRDRRGEPAAGGRGVRRPASAPGQRSRSNAVRRGVVTRTPPSRSRSSGRNRTSAVPGRAASAARSGTTSTARVGGIGSRAAPCTHAALRSSTTRSCGRWPPRATPRARRGRSHADGHGGQPERHALPVEAQRGPLRLEKWTGSSTEPGRTPTSVHEPRPTPVAARALWRTGPADERHQPITSSQMRRAFSASSASLMRFRRRSPRRRRAPPRASRSRR